MDKVLYSREHKINRGVMKILAIIIVAWIIGMAVSAAILFMWINRMLKE